MVDSSRRLLDEVTTRLERLTALAEAGGLDAPVDMITRGARRRRHRAGVRHRPLPGVRDGDRRPRRRADPDQPHRAARRRALRRPRRRRSSPTRPPSSATRRSSTSSGQTIQPHPEDIFVIASNSGVNGSIVGSRCGQGARPRRHRGHQPRAHRRGRRPSTRAAHASATSPTSSSTTWRRTATPRSRSSGGIGVGAVSSITAAFIAQLLTIGVAERITAAGERPADLPLGQHPRRGRAQPPLEDRYADRLRRTPDCTTSTEGSTRVNTARQNTSRHLSTGAPSCRGALAAAAVIPLSSALAACAGGGRRRQRPEQQRWHQEHRQPVRHGGQGDGRRGDLRRRLRHRLRLVRRRDHAEEPRRVHGEGLRRRPRSPRSCSRASSAATRPT